MKWFDRILNSGKEPQDVPKVGSASPVPEACVQQQNDLHNKLRTLTPRERDVFDQLITGKTLKQTAELLRIQFTTVNTHYKSIYKKLEVKSRAELILRYGMKS